MATFYTAIDTTDAAKGAAQFDKLVSNTIASANKAAKAHGDAFKKAGDDIGAAAKSGTGAAQSAFKAAADGIGRAVGGATSAVMSLKGALIGLGTVAVAKNALQAADAYTLLNARLAMFAPTGENSKAIFDKLEAAAKRAQTPIEEFAGYYVRTTNALQRMNVSTDDQIKLLETLFMSMRMSGASSEGAKASLGQLAQAFDSGILRGEEYNSMMENGAAAMRIFADHSGKTLGQLKSLADQGAIAARIPVRAWIDANAEVAANMADVPKTVSAAASEMLSSLTIAFDKAAEKAKVTENWSNAVKELNKTLASSAGKAGLQAYADLLSWVGDKLAAAAKNALGLGASVRALIEAGKGNLTPLRDLMDPAAAEAESKALADLAAAYDAATKGARAGAAALGEWKTSVERAGGSKTDPFGEPAILKQQRLQTELARAQLDQNAAKQAQLKVELELASTITGQMREQDAALAGTLEKHIRARGELEKQQALRDISKQIEDARAENGIAAALASNDERQAAALQAQLAIRQKITPELRSVSPELARQLEGEVLISEELKRRQKISDELRAAGERVAGTLADGIENAISSGKKFGEAVADITKQIAAMLVKITLIEPAVRSAGHAFSNALGGTPYASLFSAAAGTGSVAYAQGASAASGGWATTATTAGDTFGGLAFARGTVLQSPARFAAGGVSGQAGEAGPEAILPLKRGPDGSLGVTSTGSAAASVVNIYVSGEVSDASMSRLRSAVDGLIRGATPRIVREAVAAVGAEHRADRSYLAR